MSVDEEKLLALLDRPSAKLIADIWENLPSAIEADLEDKAAIERVVAVISQHLRLHLQ